MPLRIRLMAAALVLLVAGAASGCGSSRTKTADGVEMTLLSVARLDSFKSGMDTAVAVRPDDELAVAQVQFSDAGKGSVKLPAAECVMIDEKGAQYRPEIDTELTFGSGDQVMVWDFVFAVPKAAKLQSVRFGAVSFDLGGVRDLDPGTRVTPGIHSRQSR